MIQLQAGAQMWLGSNNPRTQGDKTMSETEAPIQKPFAGFADFPSCLRQMRHDGHDEESARRICGRLQADAEGKSKDPYRLELHGPLVTLSKSARVIGGYANVSIVDTEGDLITVGAWREAAKKYMASGFPNVNLKHSSVTIGGVIPEFKDSQGRVWTTHVDDVGFFVVVKIRDDLLIADKAWDLIEAGKLREFSISGSALPGAVKLIYDSKNGLHREISGLELYETTVCERGINQGAGFMILKSRDADMYHFEKTPGTAEATVAGLIKAELMELVKSKLVALLKYATKEECYAAIEDFRLMVQNATIEDLTEDPTGPDTAPNIASHAGEGVNTKEEKKKMPKEEKKSDDKQDGAAPPAADGPPKELGPAIIEKLDLLTQAVNRLTDLVAGKAAAAGTDNKPPPEQKGTTPAAPPAPTPEEVKAKADAEKKTFTDAVAAEVKSQLEKMAAPEKRSQVPNAGSPGADPTEGTTSIVSKALDAGGWESVEELADALRKSKEVPAK